MAFVVAIRLGVVDVVVCALSVFFGGDIWIHRSILRALGQAKLVDFTRGCLPSY